jgi:hypothetical protein
VIGKVCVDLHTVYRSADELRIQIQSPELTLFGENRPRVGERENISSEKGKQ